MRFPYSTAFDPPAPFVEVFVSFKGRTERIPAKIDTGADRTTAPNSLVSKLSLQQISEIAVTAATGPSRKVGVYVASLEVLGMAFEHYPLVALNQPYMLIGRDILNQWVLTLDGPSLEFEIRQPSG